MDDERFAAFCAAVDELRAAIDAIQKTLHVYWARMTALEAALSVEKAVKWARDAAIIRDPSRLFAERIGEPIARGMAQGIADGTVEVQRSVDELLGKTTTE